jgi:hypothetical protein
MVTATVVNKHPDRERRGPLHPSDPSQTSIAGAISLVKELNDMSSLAFALYFAGILARFEQCASVSQTIPDLQIG